MKYMIPEINISKFSEENIVTLSATGQAINALKDAGIVIGDANRKVQYTAMNEWVQK